MDIVYSTLSVTDNCMAFPALSFVCPSRRWAHRAPSPGYRVWGSRRHSKECHWVETGSPWGINPHAPQ